MTEKSGNGTLKYLGFSGSAVALLGTLLFGMARYSQSQMSDFIDRFDVRMRIVEEGKTRLEEQMKRIDENTLRTDDSVKRIEAKVDSLLLKQK